MPGLKLSNDALYKLTHPERPGWALLLKYRGFFKMNGHTFHILAAQHGDRYKRSSRGTKFCLHEPWLKEFTIRKVDRSELPLWVSADWVTHHFDHELLEES